MYFQTLNEARLELSQHSVEQLEKQLDDKYCSKMHQALTEMRQRLDDSIAKNRLEISAAYEDKVKFWKPDAILDRKLCNDDMYALQLLDLQNVIAQERLDDTVMSKELNSLVQKMTSMEKLNTEYARMVYIIMYLKITL